jgi:hypothetical protein
MSAILHCIVTDIENSRMKDQLRAWKAKTDADPLIQKIRRLEERGHRAEWLGAHIVHAIGSSINDTDALINIWDVMYSRENDNWNFEKYAEYYEEACRETPLPEVSAVTSHEFLGWTFFVDSCNELISDIRNGALGSRH